MGLRGYVDKISHQAVAGWATDDSSPEIAIGVIIVVNGAPVGGVLADQFRADLVRLSDRSTGRYGFEFLFNPSLSLFTTCVIEVRFESNALVLDNGARSLPKLTGLRPRIGSYSPTPILVSALGRSGTSLLMSRLQTHKDIVVAGDFPYEIKLLSYYSMAFRTMISEGDRERSTNPDTMASESSRFNVGFNPFNHSDFESVLGGLSVHEEFFREVVPKNVGYAFHDIVAEYYKRAGAAKRKAPGMFIAEKIHPDINSRMVPRLLFGRAKEIMLVRDPRDLLCSFDKFWNVSGDQVIKSIADTLFVMSAIADEGREDTLVVRFEDLVLNQSDTLRQISSFLELDGDLNIDNSEGDAQFRLHGTAQTPRESIGRWRSELEEPQINKCLVAFDRYLTQFRYDT